MKLIKQALSPVLGEQAETKAKKYLQAQGLRFLQSNYRCRSGEIDLIMQDQDELVFVEVKFRSGSQFGEAVEFFHTNKRKKFESAIGHYLHEHKLNPASVAHRIDVVGINRGDSQVQWLKYV